MSQITKKALAESLKNMLAEKPLDKITVVDIVNDCGVNRQTFYYHFQDIYDLMEWTFLKEAAAVLQGNKTYETWQQGYLQIFQYVSDNRALMRNVYYSMNREVLEYYLYDVMYHMLIAVIQEQAEGLSVQEEDQKFIADFYKYVFVGFILELDSHRHENGSSKNC